MFIGPSAALTNDPYPPSGKLVGVTIEDDVIIGSRAVIKAGVTIGEKQCSWNGCSSYQGCSTRYCGYRRSCETKIFT